MSLRYPKVRFVKGTVEKIPFPDNYFDHIKSTCVLAHVDRLLTCCFEIRRVATKNCTVIILLPTDPGAMNMLIKKLITYPRINRISRYPAGLIYSLDHKNSYNNILEIIKYVFRQDKIDVKHLPFFIKSSNLNLFSIVRITVKK